MLIQYLRHSFPSCDWLRHRLKSIRFSVTFMLYSGIFFFSLFIYNIHIQVKESESENQDFLFINPVPCTSWTWGFSRPGAPILIYFLTGKIMKFCMLFLINLTKKCFEKDFLKINSIHYTVFVCVCTEYKKMHIEYNKKRLKIGKKIIWFRLFRSNMTPKVSCFYGNKINFLKIFRAKCILHKI